MKKNKSKKLNKLYVGLTGSSISVLLSTLAISSGVSANITDAQLPSSSEASDTYTISKIHHTDDSEILKLKNYLGLDQTNFLNSLDKELWNSISNWKNFKITTNKAIDFVDLYNRIQLIKKIGIFEEGELSTTWDGSNYSGMGTFYNTSSTNLWDAVEEIKTKYDDASKEESTTNFKNSTMQGDFYTRLIKRLISKNVAAGETNHAKSLFGWKEDSARTLWKDNKKIIIVDGKYDKYSPAVPAVWARGLATPDTYEKGNYATGKDPKLSWDQTYATPSGALRMKNPDSTSTESENYDDILVVYTQQMTNYDYAILIQYLSASSDKLDEIKTLLKNNWQSSTSEDITNKLSTWWTSKTAGFLTATDETISGYKTDVISAMTDILNVSKTDYGSNQIPSTDDNISHSSLYSLEDSTASGLKRFLNSEFERTYKRNSLDITTIRQSIATELRDLYVRNFIKNYEVYPELNSSRRTAEATDSVVMKMAKEAFTLLKTSPLIGDVDGTVPVSSSLKWYLGLNFKYNSNKVYEFTDEDPSNINYENNSVTVKDSSTANADSLLTKANDLMIYGYLNSLLVNNGFSPDDANAQELSKVLFKFIASVVQFKKLNHDAKAYMAATDMTSFETMKAYSEMIEASSSFVTKYYLEFVEKLDFLISDLSYRFSLGPSEANRDIYQKLIAFYNKFVNTKAKNIDDVTSPAWTATAAKLAKLDVSLRNRIRAMGTDQNSGFNGVEHDATNVTWTQAKIIALGSDKAATDANEKSKVIEAYLNLYTQSSLKLFNKLTTKDTTNLEKNLNLTGESLQSDPNFTNGIIGKSVYFTSKAVTKNEFTIDSTDVENKNKDDYNSYITAFASNKVKANQININSAKMPKAPFLKNDNFAEFTEYNTAYKAYLDKFNLFNIENDQKINLGDINYLEGKIPLPSAPTFNNNYNNASNKEMYFATYKSYLDKVAEIYQFNKKIRNTALKSIVSIFPLTNEEFSQWTFVFSDGSEQVASANQTLSNSKTKSDISYILVGSQNYRLDKDNFYVVWNTDNTAITQIIPGKNITRGVVGNSSVLLTLRNSLINQITLKAKEDYEEYTAIIKMWWNTIVSEIQNSTKITELTKKINDIQTENDLSKIDGYVVSPSDIMNNPSTEWDKVFAKSTDTAIVTKANESTTLKTEFTDNSDSDSAYNNTSSKLVYLDNIVTQINNEYTTYKTVLNTLRSKTQAAIQASLTFNTSYENNSQEATSNTLYHRKITELNSYINTPPTGVNWERDYPSAIAATKEAIKAITKLHNYSKYIATRFTNWDATQTVETYSTVSSVISLVPDTNYVELLNGYLLALEKVRFESSKLAIGESGAEASITENNKTKATEWFTENYTTSNSETAPFVELSQKTKDSINNLYSSLSTDKSATATNTTIINLNDNTSILNGDMESLKIDLRSTYSFKYNTASLLLEEIEIQNRNMAALKVVNKALTALYNKPATLANYTSTDTLLNESNAEYILIKNAYDQAQKIKPTAQNSRFTSIESYYESYISGLALAEEIILLTKKMNDLSDGEYTKEKWDDFYTKILDLSDKIDKSWTTQYSTNFTNSIKEKTLKTQFEKIISTNVSNSLLKKIYYTQFLNNFKYIKANFIPTLRFTQASGQTAQTWTSTAENGITEFDTASPISKVSVVIRTDLPSDQHNLFEALKRINAVLFKPSQADSVDKGITDADYATLLETITFRTQISSIDGVTDDYLNATGKTQVKSQLQSFVESIEDVNPPEGELSTPAYKYFKNLKAYAKNILATDRAEKARGSFSAAGEWTDGAAFSEEEKAVELRTNTSSYTQKVLNDTYSYLVNAYNLYLQTKELKDKFEENKNTINLKNVKTYWKTQVSSEIYDEFVEKSLKVLNTIQDSSESQESNASWTISSSTNVPTTSDNLTDNFVSSINTAAANAKARNVTAAIPEIYKEFIAAVEKIHVTAVDPKNLIDLVAELQGQDTNRDNWNTAKSSFTSSEVNTNNVYGILPTDFFQEGVEKQITIAFPSTGGTSDTSIGLKNFNDNLNQVPTYSDSSRSVDYQALFTSGKWLNDFKHYISSPTSILPSSKTTTILDMLELTNQLNAKMTKQVYDSISWANTDYQILSRIIIESQKFANDTTYPTAKIMKNTIAQAITAVEAYFTAVFADANGAYYDQQTDTALNANKIGLLAYKQKMKSFKENQAAVADYVYKYINATQEEQNTFDSTGRLLEELLKLKVATDRNGRKSYIGAYNNYITIRNAMSGETSFISKATTTNSSGLKVYTGLLELYKDVIDKYSLGTTDEDKQTAQDLLISYKTNSDASKRKFSEVFTNVLAILKDISGVSSQLWKYTAPASPAKQYASSAIKAWSQENISKAIFNLEDIFTEVDRNHARAINDLTTRIEGIVTELTDAITATLKDNVVEKYPLVLAASEKLKTNLAILEQYTDSNNEQFSPAAKRRFDSFTLLIEPSDKLLKYLKFLNDSQKKSDDLVILNNDINDLDVDADDKPTERTFTTWKTVLDLQLPKYKASATESFEDESTLTEADDANSKTVFDGLVAAIKAIPTRLEEAANNVKSAIDKIEAYKIAVQKWNAANNNSDSIVTIDGQKEVNVDYATLRTKIDAAVAAQQAITTSESSENAEKIVHDHYQKNVEQLDKFLLTLLINFKIQNLDFTNIDTLDQVPNTADNQLQNNIDTLKMAITTWYTHFDAKKPTAGTDTEKNLAALKALYYENAQKLWNRNSNFISDVVTATKSWENYLQKIINDISLNNYSLIPASDFNKIENTFSKAKYNLDFAKEFKNYEMIPFPDTSTYKDEYEYGKTRETIGYNPIFNFLKSINSTTNIYEAISLLKFDSTKFSSETVQKITSAIRKITGINGKYIFPNNDVISEEENNNLHVWGVFSYALKYPTATNLEAIDEVIRLVKEELKADSDFNTAYSYKDDNTYNPLIKGDDFVSYIVAKRLKEFKNRASKNITQLEALKIANQYMMNPTPELKTKLDAEITKLDSADTLKFYDEFLNVSDAEVAVIKRDYPKAYIHFIKKLKAIAEKITEINTATTTGDKKTKLNSIMKVGADQSNTLYGSLDNFDDASPALNARVVAYLKAQLGFSVLRTTIENIVKIKRFEIDVFELNEMAVQNYQIQKTGSELGESNTVSNVNGQLINPNARENLKKIARSVITTKELNDVYTKYLNFDNNEDYKNTSVSQINTAAYNLERTKEFLESLLADDNSGLTPSERALADSVLDNAKNALLEKDLVLAIIEYSINPNDLNRSRVTHYLFELNEIEVQLPKLFVLKTLIDFVNEFQDAENDLETYWNKKTAIQNSTDTAEIIKNKIKFLLNLANDLSYTNSKDSSQSQTDAQVKTIFKDKIKENYRINKKVDSAFIESFKSSHPDKVLTAEELQLAFANNVRSEQMAQKTAADTKFIIYVYELEKAAKDAFASAEPTAQENSKIETLQNLLTKGSLVLSKETTKLNTVFKTISAPVYIEQKLIKWANYDSDASNYVNKVRQYPDIENSEYYKAVNRSTDAFTSLSALLDLINSMQGVIDLLSEEPIYSYLSGPQNIAVTDLAFSGLIGILEKYNYFVIQSANFDNLKENSNSRLDIVADMLKERLAALFKLAELSKSFAFASNDIYHEIIDSQTGEKSSAYDSFKRLLPLFKTAYTDYKTKTTGQHPVFAADTDFWRAFARMTEFINSKNEDETGQVLDAFEKTRDYLEAATRNSEDKNDKFTTASEAIDVLFKREANSISKAAYAQEGNLLLNQLSRREILANLQNKIRKYYANLQWLNYTEFIGASVPDDKAKVIKFIDDFMKEIGDGATHGDGIIWDEAIILALNGNIAKRDDLKDAVRSLQKAIKLNYEYQKLLAEYLKAPNAANLAKIVDNTANSINAQMETQTNLIQTSIVDEYKGTTKNAGIDALFVTFTEQIIKESKVPSTLIKIVEAIKQGFKSTNLANKNFGAITLNIPEVTTGDEEVNVYELLGLNAENGNVDAAAEENSLYTIGSLVQGSFISAVFSYIANDNRALSAASLSPSTPLVTPDSSEELDSNSEVEEVIPVPTAFVNKNYNYLARLILLQKQVKQYATTPKTLIDNLKDNAESLENSTLSQLGAQIKTLNTNRETIDEDGKWLNVDSVDYNLEKLLFNAFTSFEKQVNYDLAAQNFVENPTLDNWEKVIEQLNALKSARKVQNPELTDENVLSQAEKTFHNLLENYQAYQVKFNDYLKNGDDDSSSQLTQAYTTFNSHLTTAKTAKDTFSTIHSTLTDKINEQQPLLEKQNTALVKFYELINSDEATVKAGLAEKITEFETALTQLKTLTDAIKDDAPDSYFVLVADSLKSQLEKVKKVSAVAQMIFVDTKPDSYSKETVVNTETEINENVETTTTVKTSSINKTFVNTIAIKIHSLKTNVYKQLELEKVVTELIISLNENFKTQTETKVAATLVNADFAALIQEVYKLQNIQKEITKASNEETGALTSDQIKAKITEVKTSLEAAVTKIKGSDSTGNWIEKQIAEIAKIKAENLEDEYLVQSVIYDIAKEEKNIKDKSIEKNTATVSGQDVSQLDTDIQASKTRLAAKVTEFDTAYESADASDIQAEIDKLPFDITSQVNGLSADLKTYKDLLVDPPADENITVTYQKIVEKYTTDISTVNITEIDQQIAALKTLVESLTFSPINQANENIATLEKIKADKNQLDAFIKFAQTFSDQDKISYDEKSKLNDTLVPDTLNNSLYGAITSLFSANNAKLKLNESITEENIKLLNTLAANVNSAVTTANNVAANKLTIGQRKIQSKLQAINSLIQKAIKATTALANYVLNPSNDNKAAYNAAKSEFNTETEAQKTANPDLVNMFEVEKENLDNLAAADNEDSIANKTKKLLDKVNSGEIVDPNELAAILNELHNLPDTPLNKGLSEKIKQQLEKIQAISDLQQASDSANAVNEKEVQLDNALDKKASLELLLKSLESQSPLTPEQEAKIAQLKEELEALNSDIERFNAELDAAKAKLIADTKEHENQKATAIANKLASQKAADQEVINAAQTELDEANAETPVDPEKVAAAQKKLKQAQAKLAKTNKQISDESERKAKEQARIRELEAAIARGDSPSAAALEYAKTKAADVTAAENAFNPNDNSNGTKEVALGPIVAAEKLRKALNAAKINSSDENIAALKAATEEFETAKAEWEKVSANSKLSDKNKALLNKSLEQGSQNQVSGELISSLFDYLNNPNEDSKAAYQKALKQAKSSKDLAIQKLVADIEKASQTLDKVSSIIDNIEDATQTDLNNLKSLLNEIPDDSPLKIKLKEKLNQLLAKIELEFNLKEAIASSAQNYDNINDESIQKLDDLYKKALESGMSPETLAKYQNRIQILKNLNSYKKSNIQYKNFMDQFVDSTVEIHKVPLDNSRNYKNDVINDVKQKSQDLLESLKNWNSTSQWSQNLYNNLLSSFNQTVQKDDSITNRIDFNENLFKLVLKKENTNLDTTFDIGQLIDRLNQSTELPVQKAKLNKVLNYAKLSNKSILNTLTTKEIEEFNKLIAELLNDSQIDNITKSSLKIMSSSVIKDFNQVLKRRTIWSISAMAGLPIASVLIILGTFLLIKAKRNKLKKTNSKENENGK